jgi:hypothetical protein
MLLMQQKSGTLLEVEIHKYADGVVAETAGNDQDLMPIFF